MITPACRVLIDQTSEPTCCQRAPASGLGGPCFQQFRGSRRCSGVRSQAQEYREALLDAVVDLDDDAMEAYLDVRPPPKP